MVVLFLLLFSEGFLPWRLNGWLFLILNGRKNVGCLNDDDKSALSLSPFLPSSIFFSVSQYIESTNLCGFNKTSDEPFLLFLFFDCQTICRFNWNIIIHLCVIRKFIKMKKETTKNETYRFDLIFETTPVMRSRSLGWRTNAWTKQMKID